MDYPPTFEQQFERHDSCVLYSGILLIPVCPIMAWNKVSNRLDLVSIRDCLAKYWRNIEQPETGRRLTQRKVSLLLL